MKNQLLKRCETCKLYVAQSKACQIMPALNGRIKNDDFCSQHKDELFTCCNCGQLMLIPFVRVEKNGTVLTFCDNCIQMVP